MFPGGPRRAVGRRSRGETAGRRPGVAAGFTATPRSGPAGPSEAPSRNLATARALDAAAPPAPRDRPEAPNPDGPPSGSASRAGPGAGVRDRARSPPCRRFRCETSNCSEPVRVRDPARGDADRALPDGPGALAGPAERPPDGGDPLPVGGFAAKPKLVADGANRPTVRSGASGARRPAGPRARGARPCPARPLERRRGRIDRPLPVRCPQALRRSGASPRAGPCGS